MTAALGTSWAVPSKGWLSRLWEDTHRCCHSCTELLNLSWAEQGLAQGHGTSQGSMWGFGRESEDTERGVCITGRAGTWLFASPQKEKCDVQQSPLEQPSPGSGWYLDELPLAVPALYPDAFPVIPVIFHLQSRKGRGRMSCWIHCSVG